MQAMSGPNWPLLASISVASLSLFSVLCLWCKKKHRLIQENHIYDPQVFQREGSRFAVTRSKTVIRPNQIMRQLPLTPPEEPVTLQTQSSQEKNTQEDKYKYQNAHDATMGTCEPTYVDPIPALVYQNIDETMNTDQRDSESDTEQCPYENVFPSLPLSDTMNSNNDGSDYENSEFLEQVKRDQEDDEPDYVNADNEGSG
ncbi:LAT2 domain-containing protein [Osmerus mordax]|uniref:LAT2 domain-containing protein n=1 Tax=Osmerus mordax TaxID=8014 RepID=UPI00350EEC8F